MNEVKQIKHDFDNYFISIRVIIEKYHKVCSQLLNLPNDTLPPELLSRKELLLSMFEKSEVTLDQMVKLKDKIIAKLEEKGSE